MKLEDSIHKLWNSESVEIMLLPLSLKKRKYCNQAAIQMPDFTGNASL